MRGLKTSLAGLADLPCTLMRDVIDNPLKHIVFLILFLWGISDFPTVFSKDATTILSELSMETTVLLLIGVYVLNGRLERNSPIFPVIDRWMEAPGRRAAATCGLVGLSVAVGIALRVVNLDALDPYTDENAHLMSAYKYITGEPARYSRADWISHLVALFWRATGPSTFQEYLFGARLPGAVVGAATAIPLFFVARRVSSSVALIACFLWAVSPWAIGVSKYVREYAYFPFFILLAFNGLLAIADAHGDGWRRPDRRQWAIASGLLLLMIYALVVDPQSTMKVCFIVLAGLTVALFLKSYLRAVEMGAARRERALVAAALVLLAAAFVVVKFVTLPSMGYRLDARYLDVFFSAESEKPVMWWSRYAITPSIMSVFIFAGFIAHASRRRFAYLSILVVFLTMMTFFYLFFDRYFTPRYSFYLLPFFTILIAAGISALALCVKSFRSFPARAAALAVLCVFLFTAFRYENTARALFPRLSRSEESERKFARHESGMFPVTGEYHQNMRLVALYLKRQIRDDDIFITTIFQPMLTLGLGVPPNRIQFYNHKGRAPEKQVASIIRNHPRGWMILDYRRNGSLVKRRFSDRVGKPFVLGGRKVALVWDHHEAQVFRWPPR